MALSKSCSRRLKCVIHLFVIGGLTILALQIRSSQLCPIERCTNKDLTTRRNFQSSIHRWMTNFHDIFDVPDPLSVRIGPDNVTFKNKYVIYRCDKDTMDHCGGWADRVRSMMTSYLIANLSGRVFKAEILMPECNIEKFMKPNHVNWSLPVSFHKRVTPNATVKMLDMWDKDEFYLNFTNTDWLHHPGMKSDYFYMKGNHDNMDNFRNSKFHGKDLQWMKGQNGAALNRFLFKRLFKPTDNLRNKVIHFLSDHVKAEENLLCIHLRMGNNPTIPNETRKSYNMKYLQKVWSLINNELMSCLGEDSKVFLMSDSREAIAIAREQEFSHRIFVSPGDIIHIELSQNVTNQEICDGMEKVLFEQLVLLNCDSIILSDSGISRMAAYVKGSDARIYCFLKSGKIVRCGLENFKKIFKTPN